MQKATLLVLALLFTSVGAQAQVLLPGSAWRIDAPTGGWFANDNNVRGGAYNATTDHLIVVSRSGGLKMVVLDAATGDSVTAMDVTGIAGGTFALSEIATTSDGQIFGANLTTGPTTSALKLYRWADENAAPELIFEGLGLEGPRYGDGIGVAGSGNAVEIYVGGSGNDRIAAFDYDGNTATRRAAYLIPEADADRARYGLAPVAGEDSLWINEPGSAIAKISKTTGQIGREIPAEIVPVGFADLAYFERMGRKYLGTGTRFGGSPSEYFAVVDVTDPGMERIVYITPTLGTNANGNAAGFVAYDDTNDRLLVGATNNGIAAFDLTGFTAYEAMLSGFNETSPVVSEGTGMMSIAVSGNVLTVSGRFDDLSSGNTGAHIHTGAVGANGGVVVNLTSAFTLSQNDTRGTIRTTIDLDATPPNGISTADFMTALMNGGLYVNVHSTMHPSGELRGQILAMGNMAPSASTITAPADMATVEIGGASMMEVMPMWTASTDSDGGSVEYVWQLSTSQDFSAAATVFALRSSDPQVTAGTVGSLYQALNGTFGLAQGDSVKLYHRAIATDGSAVTEGPAAEVYFKLGVVNADQVAWRIDAPTGGWFLADNTVRGGAYNPTTDHVIVVSRSGGIKMVVLDAMTGDSVGVMSTAGISGGTFPINEIAITDDGEIFGANLSVSPATSAVKIYYWDDEFSEPQLVFESTELEGPRYGDAFTVTGTDEADFKAFISGSGNDRVAVLVVDETAGMLMLDDYLIPESGEPRGRSGLAVSPGGDSLFVQSPVHLLGKMSVTGGTARDIPASVAGLGNNDVAVTRASFDMDGMTTRDYMLTGVRFQGAENFTLVDITMPGSEYRVALTDTLGTNANGNATGFAAFDVRNNRLIVASSNNAIAAFDAPVTVTDMAVMEDAVPVAGAITSPADGAMLTLEGGENSLFMVTWSAATDDDSDLEYRWQLSASANFGGAILVDEEVQDDTEFITTFGSVDGLLESVGVLPGASATVYHRVVVTDGTNYAASDISSVTLTRGVLVDVEGAGVVPVAFRLHGTAPNPAADDATLRMDLPAQADVTLQVYDALGRVVARVESAMSPGANQKVALDTSRLPAGLYVYRVQAEMAGETKTATGRFTVVR